MSFQIRGRTSRVCKAERVDLHPKKFLRLSLARCLGRLSLKAIVITVVLFACLTEKLRLANLFKSQLPLAIRKCCWPCNQSAAILTSKNNNKFRTIKWKGDTSGRNGKSHNQSSRDLEISKSFRYSPAYNLRVSENYLPANTCQRRNSMIGLEKSIKSSMDSDNTDANIFAQMDQENQELRKYIRRKSCECQACGGSKLKTLRGHLLVLEGEASGELITYQNNQGLIKLVKQSESSSSYASNSEKEEQEEAKQQSEEDKQDDQIPEKVQIEPDNFNTPEAGKKTSQNGIFLKSILQRSTAKMKIMRLKSIKKLAGNENSFYISKLKDKIKEAQTTSHKVDRQV
ncbi:unnamed protein product [Moneuplotes crassus]|uniref:Uncharacterized protein n=1 Tax=Euplotes crassus TaxID=5936 RepID=A0AAD1UGT1_EUPCR|nr:unnamed protein product [Moneuplotes crassus]